MLDTHVLIWWFNRDAALPDKIRLEIEEEGNSIFVSAATAWEIATKFRLGKLPIDHRFISDYQPTLAEHGFISMPISTDHALQAGSLPGHHGDPFDRMIIAQAMGEDLTLVSADRIFHHYDVRLLW